MVDEGEAGARAGDEPAAGTQPDSADSRGHVLARGLLGALGVPRQHVAGGDVDQQQLLALVVPQRPLAMSGDWRAKLLDPVHRRSLTCRL
jgi:hypothetical protein